MSVHGTTTTAVGDGDDLASLARSVLDEEIRRTAPDADAAPPDDMPGVGSESISLAEGIRRGGVGVFVILLLLTSLDELQAGALATLAPDIGESFGVSDGMLVFMATAAGAFLVLGAVPMGWLADRMRRGRLIGLSSLTFSLAVFASGLAPNVFAFFFTRMGAGIAQSNSLSVHSSLIGDTFPIGVRGRLGAAFGTSQRVIAVLSPLLVGAIATAAGGPDGWRWAFLILGIPVAVVALFAFGLPEPVRGRWEKSQVLDADVSAVVDEAAPLPISMEAAFARLRSISTLRTMMLAMSAVGFAIFTVPILSSMYLKDRFGLDALERGVATTAGGIAGILVLPIVGRVYDARFRVDPAGAVRMIGLLLIPAALFVPLQLAMPNVVLYTLASIPQVVIISAVFAMVFPLLQTIVPYRLRGLGSALAAINIFFFGATGGALVSFPLTNSLGPGATIAVMSCPALIVGGLLVARGAGQVRGDLARVSAELREEHAEDVRRRSDPAGVPVLQLSGVDAAYGPVPVLFGVNFEVRRGEVLALLGTNGAGKTTVLRTVSGLLTPTRGVVRLHGRDVTFVAPEQRVRLGIVSFAGGRGVFGSLTVAENLRIAAFVHRHDPALARRRIDQSIALIPALASLLDRRAGSLSGGQQQMLALGNALVHDPEILLIDELSLGLAPAVVGDLLAVVQGLRDRGVAMVVVEQSLNVAAAIADRAIFMEKGQVRFEGSPQELARRGDLARAVFLGGDGV